MTTFTQREIDKNIQWFQGNADYEQALARLELYRYIELMVARELEGQGHVLDIGNGGFFNYNPQLAQRVTAVDLFVEDGPGPTPNSTFKRGSILDLPFPADTFDCVLAQNVLHHVIGTSVQENHRNLRRSLAEIYRCVRPGGKTVLIESTVGEWFSRVERLLFRPLLAVKKRGHPVTFQYTPGELISAAREPGFEIIEYSDVPSRGLQILQFGVVWPTALTPARPIKLVLRKT
jgi:SAM-dependent methyltransferase